MKEKILVIAPQFLGDGILSIPFFRNLRYFYKDAQIDAISKNAGKSILENVPYINNVYDLKNTEKKFIKKQNYKKVYILKRSLSALILVLGCGIKYKIGFSGQFRKPFLSKAVKYIPNQKHEKDCFLDVLKADNIEIIDDKLEYFVQDEAFDEVKQYLPEGKKALIVACASTKVKEWSQENFAEVAEFLKEKNYFIYFLGLDSEKAYCESVANGKNVYNLCGKLSFDETVAMVKNMDLVIGIDSGFCHLASAFDIKIFTIFGPTSPVQWGLSGENSQNFSLNLNCSPCKKPSACKKNFDCMKKITTENIIRLMNKSIF